MTRRVASLQGVALLAMVAGSALPAAGAALTRGQRCELWCEPGRVQAEPSAGETARLALVGNAPRNPVRTR